MTVHHLHVLLTNRVGYIKKVIILIQERADHLNAQKTVIVILMKIAMMVSAKLLVNSTILAPIQNILNVQPTLLIMTDMKTGFTAIVQILPVPQEHFAAQAISIIKRTPNLASLQKVPAK